MTGSFNLSAIEKFLTPLYKTKVLFFEQVIRRFNQTREMEKEIPVVCQYLSMWNVAMAYNPDNSTYFEMWGEEIRFSSITK